MQYMLDTSICIHIIREAPGPVIERIVGHAISDIGISAITLSELRHGVVKSARPERNRLALDEFLAPLEIAPFDETAAQAYGDIRAGLERKGRMIGPLDLLIAAHAVSLDTTLVTNNEREFRRVRGLAVENWVR